jgi:hypothetical protein
MLVVDILRTVVDEYGNSVLHYCILWWENKDNPFIRFLSKDIINIFKMLDTKTNHDIKNTANMSALDFAAFFCNHEVAKLFVRMKIEMAKEFINKEIDTLLEYAINVKIKNYVSYPWINMDVCGNIHIRINDTFDFDKTSKVLKELNISIFMRTKSLATS